MTERNLTPDPDDTEGHKISDDDTADLDDTKGPKKKDDDTPDSDDTEGHHHHH